MNQFTSWLWPDRVIGKRESRDLRDEHNRLVNSHADLLSASELVMSSADWRGDTAVRAFKAMRAALAESRTSGA